VGFLAAGKIERSFIFLSYKGNIRRGIVKAGGLPEPDGGGAVAAQALGRGGERGDQRVSGAQLADSVTQSPGAVTVNYPDFAQISGSGVVQIFIYQGFGFVYSATSKVEFQRYTTSGGMKTDGGRRQLFRLAGQLGKARLFQAEA
jgi:hypothetical protein